MWRGLNPRVVKDWNPKQVEPNVYLNKTIDAVPEAIGRNCDGSEELWGKLSGRFVMGVAIASGTRQIFKPRERNLVPVPLASIN